MQKLLDFKKTIIFSTIDENNYPLSDFSIYIMDKNKIYIFVDYTTKIYQNLKITKNANIIITEDENKAKNIFAIKKITFNAIAKEITEPSKHIFESFEKVYTKTVIKTLKKLKFVIFELTLLNGIYKESFVKTYSLAFKDEKWIKQYLDIQNI